MSTHVKNIAKSNRKLIHVYIYLFYRGHSATERSFVDQPSTALGILGLELLLKAANQSHHFVCWILITGTLFRYWP